MVHTIAVSTLTGWFESGDFRSEIRKVTPKTEAAKCRIFEVPKNLKSQHFRVHVEPQASNFNRDFPFNVCFSQEIDMFGHVWS